MLPSPRYIAADADHVLTFSVCALVRDPQQYEESVSSFAAFGFNSENSEFLAADNREENRFDGFDWQRKLLARARGEFVIFCHEDVYLTGAGYDELLAALRNLDDLDPRWLVAGVAGGAWRTHSAGGGVRAMRISDQNGEDRRFGDLPARVESLDECFMVMRRDRPVQTSYDLSGFHFYGADMCLQAELLGGSCYAIDFLLTHTGKARRGFAYREGKRCFAEKYSKIFPARYLNTTTGVHRLGGGWDELH